MCVFMFPRLLGEVRFDHQDCISKEIKEKQPFPPQKDDLWSLPDPEHTIKAERVKETTAKQRGKERLREKESPPDAGTRRHALSGPELEWIYFSSLVERV
ncbi:hypothetical protein YC2023_048812 [Brassica napus]